MDNLRNPSHKNLGHHDCDKKLQESLSLTEKVRLQTYDFK